MALQSGDLSKQEHPKLTNTKVVHWGLSARALAKHELLGQGLGSGGVKARALKTRGKPHGLKTGAINRRAFTGALKQGLSKLKLLQQRVCQRVWKKQLGSKSHATPHWRTWILHSIQQHERLPIITSIIIIIIIIRDPPQQQALVVDLRVQWSPPPPQNPQYP